MNVDGLQALMDAMSTEWQKERSKTQLTLGELISVLERMSPEDRVANLCEEHSYRGYYTDLAFELFDGTRPAGELLRDCKDAMGRVYEGYKGGDFMMGETTPVWVASYGCCGKKLLALHNDGTIETAEDTY